MDLANGSQEITGTITAPTAGWTSHLVADQSVWGPENPALLYSNNYTMALPGFADNADGPIGCGYGLVKVSTNGSVTVSNGHTPDGQVFFSDTKISKDGQWPFFKQLYPTTNDLDHLNRPMTRHRGFLMGWLHFAPNTAANSPHLAPQGNIAWIKTGWTNAHWPTGFTNGVETPVSVVSSRHVVPESGLLYAGETTNYVASFTGASIDAPIDNVLALKPNHTFAAYPANTNGSPQMNEFEPFYKNKFTVSSGSTKLGLLSGTFTNAPTAQPIKWYGVMLQDYTNGAGYFLNINLVNGGGKLTITNMPAIP